MNQSQALRQFGPRSNFYSARDLLLDNPSVSGVALVTEQSARQNLVNEAVSASKLLISSFDALRPFDALGNVEMAGDQIQEARDHALQKINNLLEAIERTNSRVSKHAKEEANKVPAPVNEAAALAAVGEKPAAGVGLVPPMTLPTPAEFAAALGLDKTARA